MGIYYLIRAYKETIKIYEDKSDELYSYSRGSLCVYKLV